MKRYSLQTAAFISAICLAGLICQGCLTRGVQNTTSTGREFYEFRVYHIANAEKQKLVDNYLEKALVPALNRQGLDRIGVFKSQDNPEDMSIYVLIPFPTVDAFAGITQKLEADGAYQAEAKEMFAQPKDNPAYTRLESRFYRAFSGMPILEMPSQTAGKQPRIFEMRIYESHNEEKAALKADMFNSGEMQVMRDTKLAPVFYGEAMIAHDAPHLMYMTSAGDMAAHEIHWTAFKEHPEWLRMKALPKYADTVSKISKWFLVPTAYSQI